MDLVMQMNCCVELSDDPFKPIADAQRFVRFLPFNHTVFGRATRGSDRSYADRLWHCDIAAHGFLSDVTNCPRWRRVTGHSRHDRQCVKVFDAKIFAVVHVPENAAASQDFGDARLGGRDPVGDCAAAAHNIDGPAGLTAHVSGARDGRDDRSYS
jgi:hypothetical protein